MVINDLPKLKYEFFNCVEKANRCFDKKSVMNYHPIMYQNRPGSGTRKEYDGLKTSLIWRGTHTERYFAARPYVVIWFER